MAEEESRQESRIAVQALASVALPSLFSHGHPLQQPAASPSDCTGPQSTTSLVGSLFLALDPLLKSQSASTDDKMQASCTGVADRRSISNSHKAPKSFGTSLETASRR